MLGRVGWRGWAERGRGVKGSWTPLDLAEGLWPPFCGEKAPAAAKRVPEATQGCLFPGLATGQHKLIQIPNHEAPCSRGLSRDSAGGNRIHLREPEACEEGSSCISPGGVVNKTPDPHPHPGRDASQPPAQSLLAHASILSPLPVSSCVCASLPLSI